MKIGFLIYSLLLALGGALMLYLQGTPMLLLGPLSGLLVYAACCRQTGIIPELVRGLTCIIMVVQAGTGMGANLEAIMFVILHIPLFIAASQCLWEIRNAPEERNKRRPQLRVTVFTAGFVACAGISFLLLLGSQLPLSLAHRQLSAGLFLVLGILAWERCRISRLKDGVTTDILSLRELIVRLGLFCAAGVLLMLLAVGVLPALSDGLVRFSPQWKLPGLKTGKGMPTNKPEPRNPAPTDDNKQTADAESPSSKDSGDLSGPEPATIGKAELPRRGTYKPNAEPRLALQFKDEVQAAKLADQGLLYVRTCSMQRYRNGVWTPSQTDGYWQTDKDDGRVDGRVTLASQLTVGSAPAGVPYTMYVMDADGTHLPHLAGVEQFDLSKVYVQSDDWFTIEPYGPVKFDAVSNPKLFQLLPEDDLREGEVAAEYRESGDAETRTKLTQLSQQIFGIKKIPSLKIRALADWFASNVSYSTTITNPKNVSALENFLFHERKGFCEHYASAACLLLRMGGLPARLTYGYHGGTYDPEQKIYTFTQAHSHAWVEVNFKNQGWVICDLTPPQSGTASGGLAGDVQGQSTGKIQTNLGSFEGVEAIVDREAAKEIKAPDLSLLERLQGFAMANAKHFGLLAGFGLLLVTGWHLWKNRNASSETQEQRAARKAAELLKQPAYFEAFTKMCGEFGHHYTPDLTLREFETQLKSIKFYHDEFASLTSYHYATRYEDDIRDSSRESRWVDFISGFAKERRQLAKEARR